MSWQAALAGLRDALGRADHALRLADGTVEDLPAGAGAGQPHSPPEVPEVAAVSLPDGLPAPTPAEEAAARQLLRQAGERARDLRAAMDRVADELADLDTSRSAARAYRGGPQTSS